MSPKDKPLRIAGVRFFTGRMPHCQAANTVTALKTVFDVLVISTCDDDYRLQFSDIAACTT